MVFNILTPRTVFCFRSSQHSPSDSFQVAEGSLPLLETHEVVRLAAFDQLVHPTVLQFVEASGLPVELLAVCLLTATALRMGQPNPAQSLTSSLRKTNQISASTTEQFIKELAPLLEVPALPSQAPQPQKEATGRFCT